MFINSLKIKNFGNISNLDATFGKINLIMGKNGSGKSKFLSTIIYSLCNHLDQKIEDYIKTGENKFNIDLDFNHLSNNYRIQIDGSKNGSDKLLTVNSSEEFKNTAMIEYIEKYIHNPKLTLASAITMQGEGSNILFEPNQKRVERLKQIFSIDRLNDVGLHLKTQMEDLKIKIKELETENATLNNTEYSYKPIPDVPDKGTILELKNEKLKLEKESIEYENKKTLYNIYLSQVKDYENAILKIESLNKKISDSILKTDELKKSIKEVTSLDVENKIIEQNKITEETKVLFDKIDSLRKYKVLCHKIEYLQKDIDELVIARLPRQGEEPEDLQDNIIKLSNQLAILQSKRDLVVAGKCQTCGQDYKEFTDITEFELQLNNLGFELQSLKDSKKQFDLAKEHYNNVKNSNEKIEIEKKHLQSNLDLMFQDKKIYEETYNDINDFNLVELENSLKLSEETYIIYTEDIKSLKKSLEDNDAVENKVKDIVRDIKIYENDIANQSSIKNPEVVIKPEEFNVELYNNVVVAVEMNEKRIQEYNTAIDYNKMLKDLETTNNKKIDENQKVLDNYRNIYKVKEQTRKIIEKDFSSWLIDKGSAYIKTKMNEFFQKSYGKYIIDLKNEDKTVDFYYTENQVDYLNVAMASGYEKEALAVAFRVALCSMQNIGIMLLDEVDSFSDESNSLRLYKSILEHTNFEQILAISHYPVTQEYLICEKDANILQL